MTPLEFQSFRAARGGQRLPVGPVPAARVRARPQVARPLARFAEGAAPISAHRGFEAPTLWDAFVHYLSREDTPSLVTCWSVT